MTQFVSNAQDSETFSLYAGIRRAELNAQDWNRDKSADLAQNEGISLNDEHWAVIVYLRNYYLEHGLPRFARTTARALNQQFAAVSVFGDTIARLRFRSLWKPTLLNGSVRR